MIRRWLNRAENYICFRYERRDHPCGETSRQLTITVVKVVVIDIEVIT